MQKTTIALVLYFVSSLCFINSINSQPYKPAPTKVNDLVHTKLQVSFDYKKCYLYGEEWITLTPHFYPTDSLRLDAKGMEIKSISVIKDNRPVLLQYTYDSLALNIQLDRLYQNKEKYVVHISYIAKPNERTCNKDEKGLYFTNPDGSEKNKPTQIYTQGEPDYASGWFPTIDEPNQKSTSEIIMTVPSKYVSLSNGKLVSQKLHADNTRTDIWVMDLPHAPYLFMMAVGDFRIYKDTWKGKEVSYYLEPAYAPYSKSIFGITPEVIGLFSTITGVDFPWNKYAQVVVRDFVSGAMENTTAAVHGEGVQGNERDLADRQYDFGIAHELFHQWFGDYVTAESWNSLTMNESFADLAELLWAEYKYGQDAADEHLNEGMTGYLNSEANAKKPLMRYYYNNKKDVFDGVTYQKGGRILNMLRHYLGNAAFYKGLNIYLTRNAFKTAGPAQLQQAMQDACGKDLHWFFRQWYDGAGHPVLDISYQWDSLSNIQQVYLRQTQEGQTFTIPLAIDLYIGGKTIRHNCWMNTKSDTFSFLVKSRPDLVNVDAEKVLVAKKIDHKTLDEYAYQYFHAPLYKDRYEAIEAAAGLQKDPIAQQMMLAALHDQYHGLRLKAMRSLNMEDTVIKNAAYAPLLSIVKNDSNRLLRAQAIIAIARYRKMENIPLFKQLLNTNSYVIQGTALWAINLLAPADALPLAKQFEKDNKGDLSEAIYTIYTGSGNDEEWLYTYKAYLSKFAEQRFKITEKFAEITGRVKNPTYAQQGIEAIKSLAVQYKKYGVAPRIIPLLNNIKSKRLALNDLASAAAIDKAIDDINGAKE
jgi:aminopeptidase N